MNQQNRRAIRPANHLQFTPVHADRAQRKGLDRRLFGGKPGCQALYFDHSIMACILQFLRGEYSFLKSFTKISQ